MEQVIFSTDQTITLQVNFHGISFSFKICEQQYYFHVAQYCVSSPRAPITDQKAFT